jgi:nucleoside-diphosphate-sugar epimerase
MVPQKYETTLEAQNRDSTTFIAEKFNSYHKENGTRGTFIFLSAEPSILPIPNFEKYAKMKLEAEKFLEEECEHLDVVVLRPGLVYPMS